MDGEAARVSPAPTGRSTEWAMTALEVLHRDESATVTATVTATGSRGATHETPTGACEDASRGNPRVSRKPHDGERIGARIEEASILRL